MKLPEVAGLFLAFLARLITGAQGHWHGSPPKAEQRIYFANHQSHFDWVLIWAALPRDLRAVTRPILRRFAGIVLESALRFGVAVPLRYPPSATRMAMGLEPTG
mgnify:CR=1 FL=1